MSPTLGALTPRGRTTLGLGVLLVVGGAALRYPVVAGLGVVLVVLVVAEVLAVLGSAGLGVQRTVAPPVVVRHGVCEGVLRVRGRRRRGLLRVDLADQVDDTLVPVHLPDRPGPAADDHTRVDTGADTGSDTGSGPAAVSVGYPVPTGRRGLVDVGPVQLRRYGLTGMAARSSTTGRVDQVRVLPRRIPLHTLPRGRRRAVQGGPDSLELGGTDLVGLHEYHMGDDLRRVHWASSARTGTLMVREDAEPSEPQLLVLLDDRAASYGGGADHRGDLGDAGAALFEEAVEVAAGLTSLVSREGQPVRLRTASERHGVDLAAAPGGVAVEGSRELDFVMAEIQLTSRPPRLAVAARDLDIVVAITGPDVDQAELALALEAAPTRVLVVVDPSPSVAISHQAGAVVLRGATSVELADLWDRAVGG